VGVRLSLGVGLALGVAVGPNVVGVSIRPIMSLIVLNRVLGEKLCECPKRRRYSSNIYLRQARRCILLDHLNHSSSYEKVGSELFYHFELHRALILDSTSANTAILISVPKSDYQTNQGGWNLHSSSESGTNLPISLAGFAKNKSFQLVGLLVEIVVTRIPNKEPVSGLGDDFAAGITFEPRSGQLAGSPEDECTRF
jgi:hypothetical protein